MPTILDWVDEAPADVFDPAVDWEELAEGLTQAGGGATFSRGSGEGALVGTIPANKKRSAVKNILGAAWYDTAAPWKLHRTVPWRHPDFPWLNAETVSFVDFNPLGNPAASNNKAKIAAAVPNEDLRYRLRYSRSVTTVRFKPYNFPFATDAQMGSLPEYNRNTEVFSEVTPALELLLADTQPFLKFLEGVDETGATLVGRSFPSPVAERLEKTDLVIGWYQVPYGYVANPYVPTKIARAIGSVNSEDNWLGFFKKGTLLLEGVRVKRDRQPIWTSTNIPFAFDLYFCFKFTDPPPSAGSPVFRGWNLFPWARSGGWWSAARNGDSSKPFVPFASFDAMFTHVLAP